jgi:hypothetical protein
VPGLVPVVAHPADSAMTITAISGTVRKLRIFIFASRPMNDWALR